MLAKQQFLPRLPLPKLTDSLSKFLGAAQPLLTAKEFEETKEAVADFVNSGVGSKLQAQLKHRAKNPQMFDSWLIDLYHKNILASRCQPLFINPSMAMPPQKFKCPDDQFRFAAGVISSALEYRAKIIDQDIKPEAVKDYPLCMAQYNLLFDNTRIPKIPVDELVAWERVKPFQVLPKDAEVVIMYRNGFFRLKVEWGSSDPQSIYDSLLGLKEYSDLPFEKPIGILTTWDRDSWTKSHDRLEELTVMNAFSMDIIRNSAFVVCLDTVPLPPVKSSYSDLNRTFDQVLHGGGSALNSGNRWFDKVVQLIISSDGVWGAAYEHTPGEAFIVTALLDHIYNVNCKKPAIWQNLTPKGSSNVELEHMKFELDAQLESDIQMASKEFDAPVHDLESYVNFYYGWGRKDAHALKLYADSMVQMALQLAYYRITGQPGCCFESGSIRRFFKSRTDIIRPCTKEALDMCRVLSGETAVNMKMAKEALFRALNSHGQYLRATLNGEAFDRHIFALKALAVENGMSLPYIYSSPGYLKLQHMVLSTSQVSMETEYAGTGFVPLVTNGYGCCYNISPTKITVFMTAWKSCPTTDTKKFAAAFNDALTQLIEIVNAGESSKKLLFGGAKL